MLPFLSTAHPKLNIRASLISPGHVVDVSSSSRSVSPPFSRRWVLAYSVNIENYWNVSQDKLVSPATTIYRTHPWISPLSHYGPYPHFEASYFSILQYSPPPTFGLLPIIRPWAYLGMSMIVKNHIKKFPNPMDLLFYSSDTTRSPCWLDARSLLPRQVR